MMDHTDARSRLNVLQLAPELVARLRAYSEAVADHGEFEPRLGWLMDIRASQLNGCAFCLDMHVKEAMLRGERALRLHHVATWRESPLFSARERAALALVEALTRIGPDGIPDGLYGELRAQFGDAQLATLIFRAAGINAWNRVNVAVRATPGALDAALGLDRAGLA